MSASTFSVEGLAKLQNEEEQKEIKEQARDMDKRAFAKSMSKAADMSMKKVMQEKEKSMKLMEQRIARLLEIKISRRFEKFPWLQDKIPPLSKKPSLPELQETDEIQKLELDCYGSEKRLIEMMKMGANAIEETWGDGTGLTFLPERMRLNLKGLGSVVSSPLFLQKTQPLIDETVIEHPSIGQMSLSMRWATTVMEVLFLVHMANTNPAFVNAKNNLENKKPASTPSTPPNSPSEEKCTNSDEEN